ncbi:MAG: hypothetical protein ACTHLO_00330 [Pseudolabrys sp.]
MRPGGSPLIRLLAVNLTIGIGIAGLMLGGLMALNPGNLRGLILADRDGAATFLLLGFGLVVTFGSVAMGTAIMMLGKKPKRNSGGGGTPIPAHAVRAARRASH